jgi:hypothetical protein
MLEEEVNLMVSQNAIPSKQHLGGAYIKEKSIAQQAVSQFETNIEAGLRYFLLSSGLKNHREHRVHREKLHRSVLSVYSVVEKLYSNSLFQEKLKRLRIEWREGL